MLNKVRLNLLLVVLPLAVFGQSIPVPTLIERFENLPSSEAKRDGVMGKGALVGVDDEGLPATYPLPADMLDPLRGTISFWVSPLDWSGDDKPFHDFITAQGERVLFRVYKYVGTSQLFFLLGPTAKDSESKLQWTVIQAPIGGWRPGQWHHVACVWEGPEMRLYIDGESAAKETMKVPLEPGTTGFKTFILGGPPSDQAAGRSVLSDFRLFNTPLSSKQVQEIFSSTRGEAGGSKLTLPQVAASPSLEGPLSSQEYSLAATGMLDLRDGSYASKQAKYHLAWDKQNLYLAVVSPRSEPMLAKHRDHDAPLWEDDSVELFIDSKKPNMGVHHFIFNSAGAIYDAQGSNAAWNAPDVRVANSIEGDHWICRVVIPFRSLGLAAPAEGATWGINIARTYAAEKLFTTSAPVKATYADRGNYLRVRFTQKTTPRLSLSSLGALNEGKMDLKLALANSGGSPASVRVVADLSTSQGEPFFRQEEVTVPAGQTKEIAWSHQGFGGQAALRLQADDSNGSAFASEWPLVSTSKFRLGYVMVDHDSEELVAVATISRLTQQGRPLSLGLAVLGGKQQTVAKTECHFSENNQEIRLPLASVSPGIYQVAVSLLDPDGKELYRETRPMEKPDGAPAWLNNSLGIDDTVPPPWTPVQVTGEAIETWGRSYDLQNAVGLPSAIKSAGQILTAGPASLICDRQVAVSEGPVKWKKQSPTEVVSESSARANNIRIRTETRFEYDGFAWVKLTIEPVEKDASLRELTMELPLKQSASTLVNSVRHSQMATNQKGLLPAEGWKLNLLKRPLFWIGNEYAGIEWFAENLEGWRWKNPEDTLEIIPLKDRNVVRWRLIDSETPVVLDKPITICFGYQVTPVRPQNDLRHEWRQGKNIQMWHPWEKVWNYPDAACKDPDSMKALEHWQKQGMRIFHYLCVGSISPDVPEWAWWAQSWQQTPPARSVLVGDGSDPAWVAGNKPVRSALVCSQPQSFNDFYLFKLQQAIRQVPINNIYFDNMYLTPSDNPYADCGWRDFEGKEQLTFPLLGLRDLVKRSYTLLKQERSEGMIVHHSSGEPLTPVNAFADIIVQGEDMVHQVADKLSYYDLLTLDKYRAQCLANPWGWESFLIPQFTRATALYRSEENGRWKTPEGKKAIDHIRGLVLVHGSNVWPGFGLTMDDIWKVQDAFGKEIEFFPYWETNPFISLLSPRDPKVFALSGYRKKGSWLLIVFNDKDQPQTFTVGLAPGPNQPSAKTVADTLSGETFAISAGGKVEVPVAARGFRLLAWPPLPVTQ